MEDVSELRVLRREGVLTAEIYGKNGTTVVEELIVMGFCLREKRERGVEYRRQVGGD